MPDDRKPKLDEPYEKWAQHKESIWPHVKYRFQVAAVGAVAGAFLGLLIFGLVWLENPGQTVWSWGGFGLTVAGVAFVTLIQGWRK